MALDDNTKERCELGNLKDCNNFIPVDVISQYEQEVTSKNLGTNNDGNLTSVITALTGAKKDLFKEVCSLIKDCSVDSQEGYKLDCIASILGISRNTCDGVVYSDEVFRKIIKNRIFELGNPNPTFKEFEDHLKEIFGDGFKICSTNCGIDIIMEREFTADEQANLEAYLNSIPFPNNCRARVINNELKPCLYLQADANDIEQGILNEADLNCDPNKKGIWVKKQNDGDDFEQCFVLNPPPMSGSKLYPWISEEAGLNVGANINCASNKTGEDPIINAIKITYKDLVGEVKRLTADAVDDGVIVRYEWRDENRRLISTAKTLDYTYLEKNHLIILTVYDNDGNEKSILYNMIGVVPPEIEKDLCIYLNPAGAEWHGLMNKDNLCVGDNALKDNVGKQIVLDPKSIDNVRVTRYEWLLDGQIVSNDKSYTYTFEKGEHVLTYIVYDDDDLTDARKWTMIGVETCIYLNPDTGNIEQGYLNKDGLCTK